jgi:hypothetical protein
MVEGAVYFARIGSYIAHVLRRFLQDVFDLYLYLHGNCSSNAPRKSDPTFWLAELATSRDRAEQQWRLSCLVQDVCTWVYSLCLVHPCKAWATSKSCMAAAQNAGIKARVLRVGQIVDATIQVFGKTRKSFHLSCSQHSLSAHSLTCKNRPSWTPVGVIVKAVAHANCDFSPVVDGKVMRFAFKSVCSAYTRHRCCVGSYTQF